MPTGERTTVYGFLYELYINAVFEEVYPLIERLFKDLKEKDGIEMMDVLDLLDNSDPGKIDGFVKWLDIPVKILTTKPGIWMIKYSLNFNNIQNKIILFLRKKLKKSIDDQYASVKRNLASVGSNGIVKKSDLGA
ncbi:MAG: hypothetical protein JRI86_13870 [Deltaproteobacteria bacterium]|nr:hypothetical protein [Deltaproteobacteria bacterium]